jgi:soluble lytic murein transglycosylase
MIKHSSSNVDRDCGNNFDSEFDNNLDINPDNVAQSCTSVRVDTDSEQNRIRARRLGLALAIFTSSCWAVLAIGLKIALRYSDSITIAWFRLFVAFLFFAGFLAWKNPQEISILRRPPLLGIIAGLCTALNYYGYMKGVEFTSPSNAQIFIQAAPILLIVAGILFFGEKPSSRQALGFLVTGIGFALFYRDQFLAAFNHRDLYVTGNSLIFVAALGWAIFASLQKLLVHRGFSPTSLNLLINGTGALCLLPMSNWQGLAHLTPWAWILFIGLALNTVLSYSAFGVALKLISAAEVSIIITLSPLLTISLMTGLAALQVTWIQPDTINTLGWIGAVTVVFGVVVTVVGFGKLFKLFKLFKFLNFLAIAMFITSCSSLSGFHKNHTTFPVPNLGREVNKIEESLNNLNIGGLNSAGQNSTGQKLSQLNSPDEIDPAQAEVWLENQLKLEPTPEMKLLVRYREAALWRRTQPLKACALWSEIAQFESPRSFHSLNSLSSQSEPLTKPNKLITLDTEFPITIAAAIRALEVCPITNSADTDRQIKALLAVTAIPKSTLSSITAISSISSISSITSSPPLFPSPSSSVSVPWLHDMALRMALGKAKELNDRALEMRLIQEQAPTEKLQRDRVNLYLRALALAKELGDETNIKLLQTQLQLTAPRFNESPVLPSEWLQVAADFKQSREFTKAREFYQKTFDSLESNDLEKLRALDGIRNTFKLEKKTVEYLESTHKYSSFARRGFFEKAKGLSERPLLSKYLETQITLARALWTEERPDEAKKVIVKVEHDLKDKIPVAEATLLRARIEEEAGQTKDAVATLESIDLKSITDRSLRQRILWCHAWNLKRMGLKTEAIDKFTKLLSEDDSPSQLARDHFWLAKTYLDSNDQDQAKTHFDWLLANDSMGIYGLFTYRELKRPLPTLNAINELNVQRDLRPTNVISEKDRFNIEWLIAVGEPELSRRLLEYSAKGLRPQNPDATLDLLSLYARTGHFQGLFSRLYELPADTRTLLLNEHPDLLFPRPWPNLVKRASKRFDVRSELIYSIMRQESSFNPTARSPADAYGLMQLIPESAKRANKHLQIKFATNEDLYDPAMSITLGSAFVSELLRANNNGFITTVSSYNASERAIHGWLKSRYKGDPLTFIEDIPYDETRNYVKLVMRNFIFYSRLNSGSQSLEFPEWCLSGLQTTKP